MHGATIKKTCLELFFCLFLVCLFGFWFVYLVFGLFVFVCWSVCESACVCGPVGQSIYTLFAALSLLRVSFANIYISKFRYNQKAADSDDPIEVL